MKKVDPCVFLIGKGNPMFQSALNPIIAIIPNVPNKCPITQRNISTEVVNFHGSKNDEINKTADDYKKAKYFQLPMITPTLLPNGLHRSTFDIYNEEDSNIIKVSWIYENYIRMNDEEF